MIIQFIINGVIAGMIYALISLGFTLIYQIVRFFHFAHGAVYTFGAYFLYLFSMQIKLPFALAFLFACILTIMIGIFIEIGIYQPVRKRNASSNSLLIISLGIYVILQNIISIIWGESPKSIGSKEVREGIRIFDARITRHQITTILLCIFLLILFSIFMKKAKIGKALRAIANDSELAILSGINIKKYIIYAFALGSFLAAIASIFVSIENDMTPTMGFKALTIAVIASIVGGMNKLYGAAFGGFMLGVAQNLIVWKLPSMWQDTLALLILIIFLIIRPSGIIGRSYRDLRV